MTGIAIRIRHSLRQARQTQLSLSDRPMISFMISVAPP